MILPALALRLAPYAAAAALGAVSWHYLPFVGAGAQIAGFRGDLQKMQTSRDAALASLTTCRGNVATLERASKAQNEAVDALRRDSEARIAESRRALSSARSVAESHRRTASAILASRGEGDRCLAAARLIQEFAE